MIEKYLSQLVSYKTVQGNQSDFHDCLDWLESFFSERYLYTHRQEKNGSESLVATTKATKKPKLLLAAHLDVVPAHNSSFKLKSVGGKLFGRGTYDMKFAIAVFMQIVEELKESISDYDFGIMITTDEESGGEDGVKHLLNTGWTTDVSVLPDGGDNWRLEETAKGFWLIEATAEGKTAHGSRPWEGVNAIDELVDFLEEAKSFFKNQSTTSPTLTIVTIEGGEALNQVPEKAIARLDIRTTEAGNHHGLMQKLEKSASKRNIILNKKFSGQPMFTDISKPYAKSFIKHLQDITGAEPELTQSLGSSDGRFFAEKGIEVLIMRPDGGGAHSDNEWVASADLEKFKALIKNYLQEVALSID